MHEDWVLQVMWKENIARRPYLYIFCICKKPWAAAEKQPLVLKRKKKNYIAIFMAQSCFGQDMKNIKSDWKYNNSRGGKDAIIQIVAWPGCHKYLG